MAISKEPEGADKDAPVMGDGCEAGGKRKKVVVVGLGMVGIALM